MFIPDKDIQFVCLGYVKVCGTASMDHCRQDVYPKKIA